MANLPQELINEVLLRLPVKSLLRFRCVCKSFLAIIRSESFINSHFKRSSRNRNHRKLIDLGVIGYPLRIHALCFNDDFQQEFVLEKLSPSRGPSFSFSYCNGLVLLCIGELSIWNPSTRNYRILPAFPVRNTQELSFGLGYDSTANDYKAIVIISKKEWDISQVWIFELRSSCWRRIQDFPYVCSIEDGGNGDCFVDGALHFICHDIVIDEYEPRTVVAFDVAKETFSVVHVPFYPVEVVESIHLSVFGGCLSIAVWCMTTEEGVDIYVRKKEGVTFTWTGLYSVSKQQFSEKGFFDCFAEGRVAYPKEGDKVFLSYGSVCSYDLKEKSLQRIATKETNNLGIFSCTESLVSVGSQDEEE